MDYLILPFLLLLLYNYVYATSWINAEGFREYCEAEIFTAECPAGHVIFMRSAQYGRMKFGRCVDRDYGYIGCANDVLKLADGMCSGKPSCQIPIPNSAFKSTRPCPKDLKPYLEASYECLPVEIAESQSCAPDSSRFVLPSTSAGYIANYVTMETGLGAADCPWMIQARPGQRVNITLIDFASSTAAESNSVSDEYDICHVYAVMREHTKTGGVTVCGGRERERHVYTSIGSSVELRILGGKFGDDAEYFLIQFEVTGCPNPVPPDHTWMKRNVDSAVIGCPDSGQTWNLYCVDNEWEGEVGNCTGEVSLVIVIAIAVGIGIIVLSIGLICMRGRKREKKNAKSKPVQSVPPIPQPDYKPEGHGSLPPPPEFLMNEGNGLVVENEYAYIADMPPPPPSPSPPPPAPPFSAPPYPHPSSSPNCHKATSRDPLMMSHDQLNRRDSRHSTAFPFPPPPPEVLTNPSFISSPHHIRNNSQPDSGYSSGGTLKYGAIRVKEVAPYSVRTCHGLQHTDSSPKFNSGCDRSPYKTRNGEVLTVTYSDVPSYFELEPDAIPRDAVPYEYGYSCKTGEKFTVYHAKSMGKNYKGTNKKKQKHSKKTTGTM